MFSKTTIVTKIRFCILISLLVATANASSAENETKTAALSLIEQWNTANEPGVAVAVTHNGELVLSHGAGLAQLEYGIPIQPNTVFPAASISKQFTAFAIMLLKDEGKLSLEDDIRDYLPALKRDSKKITIQHLLNHTSGFRELGTLTNMVGRLDEDVTTNAQAEQLIFNQTGQNFVSGARVEYNNTGYFLLTKIVEQITNQPFSKFMHERVFLPLGMHNTQFNDDRTRIIPNRAYSYAQSAHGFQKLDSATEVLGSTGIHTTVLDLIKWSNNFLKPTVGNTKVMQALATRSFAQDSDEAVHANGQELRQYNELLTWVHGGRSAGFRAFLIRIPDHEFAVAVLSNRADFDAAKLAFSLTDLYLPRTTNYVAEAWEIDDQNTLEQYEGDYELYSGSMFTISAEQGQLFFSSFNSDEKMQLPQIGERRFSLNSDFGIALEFNQDEHQRTHSLNYIFGQMGSLKARKLKLLEFDSSEINLMQYVGKYYSEELQSVYTVTTSGNSLIVSPPAMQPITLTPYQSDTFSSAEGNFPKIQFQRGANSTIDRCLISGPLADDVEFIKIALPD